VEPLCAYYSARCLPAVEHCLAAGDRRVIAFFEEVRMVRMSLEEVSTFGDPATMFMNVNTPLDLDRAESYAAAAEHRRS
jgi:molybdopterin-guanine dinucleotide biosynthesis protein A